MLAGRAGSRRRACAVRGGPAGGAAAIDRGTPAAGDAAPPARRGLAHVYGPAARWGLSAAAVAVGVVGTVASGFVDDSKPTYLLTHAVTALPFTVAGAALSWGALRGAPAAYRPFWRPWFAANCLIALASVAAVVGVVAHLRVFVALDVAFIVASSPLWTVASVRMLRIHSGRLSLSVDLVDGVTALLVLGLPWMLVLAEPLAGADELLFAVPFAVATVLAPAGLYLALVELARVPAGERVPHGIGLALGAAFTVSITMQLAQVVARVDLPLPAFIGLHQLVMALTVAVPLWASAEVAGAVTARGAADEGRRPSPMPAVAAVALPLLGAYVWVTRDERAWGVPAFVVVVLAVVALDAVRHTAMAREARRLQAGLAEAAEERGRLLAAMLRALEDDRHRTATELHTQAVGSLTTLGTIIQTAAVTLPPATATAVTETIAGLQGDLTDRAEELRQLMVAMRAPAFSDRTAPAAPVAPRSAGHDDQALGAALRAYAAELVRGRPGPEVSVAVDPDLRLDWSTMTIAYRIAQEALANAARHAGAGHVAVAVDAAAGGILVEVRDDGCGFDPPRPSGPVPCGRASAGAGVRGPGSGLGTMALFASLGRGELSVDSAPGRGTVVRAALGTRPARPPAVAPAGRSHLRLVTGGPAPAAPIDGD